MNSYNENLHSTVVSTLYAQELEQKTMKASLDASMFTLYYAGGARITASEKLNDAQKGYTAQRLLKEQAVINNNISVNLLTAANQEKQFVAQSVTNTSVAAANIQAASNAVLKLAGNVGSIYSMVSAADYHSDIYTQSKEAYRLMRITAYDAEQVSQLAMEASTLTAEVSSAMVADEAKTTNDAVGNLFKIISGSFDAITQVVAADNAILASASAAEKQAEGTVEALNVEYFAARNAYELNNKELNIDLKVPAVTTTKDSYTVSFNYYKSAFPLPKMKKLTGANEEEEEEDEKEISGYPVENYYIMLVKDSQKSTFTLTAAESMLTDKNLYVKIPAKHKADKTYIEKKLFISTIKDSDGKDMQLGENYVVFVMAELMTDYKKNINDFSDYLSAPSPVFTLTNKLTSPKADDIKVNDLTTVLTFNLEEFETYKVEYRCMFLPVSKNLTKGLLSEQGLRTIEAEVERLEKIHEKYDPQIQELEASVASLQSDYDAKEDEIEEAKDRGAPHKEIHKLEAERDEIYEKLRDDKDELAQLEKDKAKEMSTIDPSIESSPGFFFNLAIAEQVAPANYEKATMETDKKEKSKDKHNPKVSLTGTVNITDTVTDNFGTPLMKDYSYIPVVLSFASPLTQIAGQYTNSLSAYASTKPFVYKGVEEVTEVIEITEIKK